MKNEIVICDLTDSVWGSAIKDGITFGWLILCILISTEMGSWWWSLFTTGFFLYYVFCWNDVRSKFWRLRNKEEAIRWAHGLPDDGSSRKIVGTVVEVGDIAQLRGAGGLLIEVDKDLLRDYVGSVVFKCVEIIPVSDNGDKQDEK